MAQTIELNGKRYDAATGLPIKSIAKKPLAPSKPTAKPAQAARRGGVFIDGVRRPMGQAMQNLKKPLAAIPAKVAPKKSREPVVAAQKVHNRTQKTKTLLRKSVKAPTKVKAVGKSEVRQPSAAKPSAPKPDIRLQERLTKQVPKSELISRFAKTTRQAISLPAKQEPSTLQAVSKPGTAKVVSAKVATAAPKSNLSKKEKLIAEGLAKAQAHQEPKPTKRSKKDKQHRKFWRLALPIAAIVLVAGYVVYRSIPNIAMKVAANKAGFSANLPSYNPDGFSLKGPLAYGDGEITVGYESNTDSREYKITQKKSNWDSESLLTNVVTAKSDYQTYRDHGLTIYVFDKSNATWVSNGVWYTIEGQSELSSQQIIKIAASL